MLGLVLALALTQVAPDDDECVRGRCRDRARAMPTGSSAFFEFAPSSGRGMTAACACTTPTGAKGETMTFTRAGDATCSKQGLATTGIANGDLVVCTANQPRVESSGGVLGLRVEGARTNDVLRSSALDNAAWTNVNVGVAVPTVTADFAVAPDGTTTAERVQIPATTSGQTSERRQSGLASATRSNSLFIKGNGTSGSVQVMSIAANADSCLVCSFVADSWTRCLVPSAAAQTQFAVGNRSFTADACGTGNRSAVDILVWGAQSEAATYATSYIPTVAAAVTRNAEAAYLTLPSPFAPGSVAATTQVPYTSPGADRRAVGVRSGASDTNRFELFYTNGGPGASAYVEVASVWQQVNGVTAATMPGSNRFAAWWVAAGTQNVITNGTTASAATALGVLPVLDRVYVGSYTAAVAELNGIISQVCVDPSPSRCR